MATIKKKKKTASKKTSVSKNTLCLISKSEFARRLGANYDQILRLVKEGKIKTTDGKINEATATPQYLRAQGLSMAAAGTLYGVGGEDSKVPSFAQSRTKQAHLAAQFAEMRLAVAQGDLLFKTIVEKEAFTLGRKIRDNLSNIPLKLAPILASETDPLKIETLINEAMLEAIEPLNDNFTKKIGHIQPSLSGRAIIRSPVRDS